MNKTFEPVFKQLNEIILGKEPVLKQLIACILAGGHVLLEDVPGVGKTTLATSLAAVLGLKYQRVQFTNDMLPADLLGVNVFSPNNGTFKFHEGPVFNQFMLADEINRASPKVQSALLEAMEEGQVSVDGKTYVLPTPFLVVATQNPSEQLGTFPLPESQLDRFMMRLSMGYPVEEAEKMLYHMGDRRQLVHKVQAIASPETLHEWQTKVKQVTVSEAVAAYIYRLVAATRRPGLFALGLSPRAGLAVANAAKAWAFLDGRDFVLPEDVKAVWISVGNHRLQSLQQQSSSKTLAEILENVAV
ncbi:MoxR family ATPase [Kingella negevensis]|uniref:AAA family ATPase n=1 Tax=Kingella negevensis TaxID=1522312 RepID=UPI00254BBCF1|nr:MoxR family ATPase [Kingella negevensis]MDK4685003.1 MoxR family ATPase [Kingella negevensis]MDK4708576.1 MoxR family ATPase [Kingella negevensis]MDK4710347.1 MoxR family ATPase [Kingella negevensis]